MTGIRQSRGFEFPDDLKPVMQRARRMEYLTIAYLLSAIVVLGLVLGQSQALKTAWFDDVLSLIPPIVFLVGSRVSLRPPNERFPFGHHRFSSAAYLGASLSLLTMGGYLLVDAAITLVMMEHPTIGSMQMFGYTVWMGWPMIAALLYSAIPAIFIGRVKLPMADRLYDKVLFADAKMNKADWLTGAAAIIGILGIGYGFWWADSVAAALISLDILHDGWTNTKSSVLDLVDQKPQKVDRSGPDPVVDRVRERLCSYSWVRDADLRLRVNGHILFGEAFIVPTDDRDLTRHVEQAVREIRDLDWRLHDVSVTPVTRLAHDVEEKRGDADG
jgi:cation diffusion facilitator family transporter